MTRDDRSPLLTSEQRPLLERLASAHRDDVVRRRARLLLLYDAGHPTDDVAQAVDLSADTVRRWRRRFRDEGLALFPDDLRGGAAPAAAPALDDPAVFLNRELSLLAFQRRVLEEAQDEANPLLERVKFLSIVGSNLDEFFMVRVGGLKKQVAAGVLDPSPDGRTPAEQLSAVRREARALMAEARTCLTDELRPQLREAGLHVLDYDELDDAHRERAARTFRDVIFPVLTPLAFDPGRPFPHISNLSLNLAVLIHNESGQEHFARIKIPSSLPRVLPLDRDGGRRRVFVWIEQVIAAHLHLLFPGMEVREAYPFRVTRNADIVIQELEADDLLETMEQGVRQRRFGAVTRVTVGSAMPERLRALLMDNLDLEADDLYTLDGPMGLSALMGLYGQVERYDLRDAPFTPSLPAPFHPKYREEDHFATIDRAPRLLHLPYDSFTPLVDFLEAAAADPDVLAIKQTLYRVGQRAPVVKALLKARENGKQVAVLVELKARFDEESNIGWARTLEREGVHVIYGLLGLKTHAKLALVVRREGDRIRRYLHLSTGNYNAVTARIYEDLGYYTSDEDLGADATDLFNYLTGYSAKKSYRKLLVGPINLRARLTALVEREIEHQREGRGGHLVLKMNALVDPRMIRLLYRASQAGVRVELIVRGICCLRPGVPGLSDHITVRSIVGRFLEHSRIYYFRNGGTPEIYLGSADLMPRNLDRRVEVVFPIEDAGLIRYLHDEVLMTYLRDNVRARLMQPDGTYVRVAPDDDEEPIDAQATFLDVHARRARQSVLWNVH